MPRLSNLQYLKNNSKKELLNIKNRLDPRTYASYVRKIDNAIGMSSASKLASEIRLIKNKPAQQGLLTAKKIKEQKTTQTTKKAENLSKIKI